jgi:hypothetical protein
MISFGTVQQTFESGWPDGGFFRVGHLKTAREAWQQALDILDDLRHPDAEPVRTKLRRLDAGEAPRTGN